MQVRASTIIVVIPRADSESLLCVCEYIESSLFANKVCFVQLWLTVRTIIVPYSSL